MIGLRNYERAACRAANHKLDGRGSVPFRPKRAGEEKRVVSDRNRLRDVGPALRRSRGGWGSAKIPGERRRMDAASGERKRIHKL